MNIFNRRTLIAIVAGTALVGGVAAWANGNGVCGWHHGMTSGQGAADVSAHVDHMLKYLYVEIDATDAQKAQITPMVKQAMNDLLPLHTQLRSAHTEALAALTANPVDRAALETSRLAHLQLADQASKRLVQLVGDVSEVLTPAQRSAFAAHLKDMHGNAAP